MQRDPEEELARLSLGINPEPLVTPLHPDRGTLTDEEATHLVGMVFESRSGSTRSHMVFEAYDGIPRCICRATHTCWAVKAYCKVKGIATP